MQVFGQLLVFGTLFVLCLADGEILNLTHALSKCGGKEKASTLLDVSKDFINKAKNMYPNCIEDDQNCGKEKSLAFLDIAMNVISEVKKEYPTCPEPECPKPEPQPECPKPKPEPECPKPKPEPECPKCNEKPMDCSDILRSGKKKSGVYTIWPKSRILSKKSLSVYCDMDTNGGGWTVIQRRGKFSTPKDYFYKDWKSYKNGFGNLTEEFWIGNDNIFAISNQGNYTIRFDLKDNAGKTGYAEYNTFWIEEENANYTLHIDGYKGNVGNSMRRQDKMKFSTKDRDNDLWGPKSCAVDEQGAWWYQKCANSNLNGLYQPGIVSDKGCYWFQWKATYMGLSGVEIKLRP